MTTKPKSTKAARREALERMTKGELVKTVLSLDARQTKLLNEVANAKDMCEAHSAAAVALQTDNMRLTVRVTELEAALRKLHAGINGERLLRLYTAVGGVDGERPSYVKPAEKFGEAELETALFNLYAGINEDRLLRINPDALETAEIEILSPEDQAKRGGFKVTRRPPYVKPAITEIAAEDLGDVSAVTRKQQVRWATYDLLPAKFPWEA